MRTILQDFIASSVLLEGTLAGAVASSVVAYQLAGDGELYRNTKDNLYKPVSGSVVSYNYFIFPQWCSLSYSLFVAGVRFSIGITAKCFVYMELMHTLFTEENMLQ